MIVIVIVVNTRNLLKELIAMALDRVPSAIAHGDVEDALSGMPGVVRVHDLHIWPMSTTEVAMTAHLVMPGGCPDDGFLHASSEMFRERFAIGHATLQVERGEDGACLLEPAASG